MTTDYTLLYDEFAKLSKEDRQYYLDLLTQLLFTGKSPVSQPDKVISLADRQRKG